MSSFDRLHSALQYHIVNSLGWTTLRPTQLDAIGPVLDGVHCLLLAPTAGGKTEAAVMPVLSRMLTEDWRGLSVLYICPIKALLNNLEERLSYYAGLLGRRVGVWHGDVSDSVKRRLRSDPPDILLTTPESLEGMLISPRIERDQWFNAVRVAVIDELHAFAGDDRGWHLRSVLTRLDRYAKHPLQRLGLSATVQNPVALLAWLTSGAAGSVVGSSAVSTDADVTIDHVGSVENAATVISRLHRGEKRLVFCDSRSVAERLGHALIEARVHTHLSHASLSASERRAAERAFAEETDCVIVATSTLELGIDVGGLDRVIQIDSPTTVSSFLQRMGRSGRRAGTRRNCLFLTLSESGFLQALGISRLWASAWVEPVEPPPLPWNVAAQQALLVALERGQCTEAELRDSLRCGFPELARDGVDDTLEWLTELGYLTVSAGVAQIGPAAEKAFGRSHYRELLATFSGSELLLAQWGSRDIGYIDPAALVGTGEEKRVLLGGRSWLVTSVDFSKRLATLQPSDQPGKARWMGSSASLGFEAAQSIRLALRDGMPEIVRLSRRAAEMLETLRDDLPTAASPYPVAALDSGRYRLWSYAGTTHNRSLMANSRSQGAVAMGPLHVDFTRHPGEIKADPAHFELTAGDPLLTVMKDDLKFSDLVPPTLLLGQLTVRYFAQWDGSVPGQARS